MMSLSRECGRVNTAVLREVCRAIDDYFLEASPPYGYGVFTRIVGAVISVESCFDPVARSRRDALGLMQIHYPYWRKRFPTLVRSQLYDPYFNVSFGAWILDHEIRRVGLERALCLYGGFRYCHKARKYVMNILNKVRGDDYVRKRL